MCGDCKIFLFFCKMSVCPKFDMKMYKILILVQQVKTCFINTVYGLVQERQNFFVYSLLFVGFFFHTCPPKC